MHIYAKCGQMRAFPWTDAVGDPPPGWDRLQQLKDAGLTIPETASDHSGPPRHRGPESCRAIASESGPEGG